MNPFESIDQPHSLRASNDLLSLEVPVVAGDASLEYWRGRLKGMETLELPLDKARPVESSGRGGVVRFDVKASVLRGLKGVGRRHEATLFMVLLAVLMLEVARWNPPPPVEPDAGDDRTDIGSLIRNRLVRFMGEAIVFLLVSLLWVAVDSVSRWRLRNSRP